MQCAQVILVLFLVVGLSRGIRGRPYEHWAYKRLSDLSFVSLGVTGAPLREALQLFVMNLMSLFLRAGRGQWVDGSDSRLRLVLLVFPLPQRDSTPLQPHPRPQCR